MSSEPESQPLSCSWCGVHEDDAGLLAVDEQTGVSICDSCIYLLLEFYEDDALFTEEESELLKKRAEQTGLEFSDLVAEGVRWYIARYDYDKEPQRPEEQEKAAPNELSCSYCDKGQTQALRLIAHSELPLAVCEECIEHLRDVVGDDMFTPQELDKIRKIAHIEYKSFGEVVKEAAVSFAQGRTESKS